MLQDIILYFLLGFLVTKIISVLILLYNEKYTVHELAKLAGLLSLSSVVGFAAAIGIVVLLLGLGTRFGFYSTIVLGIVLLFFPLLMTTISFCLDTFALKWFGYWPLFKRFGLLKLLFVNVFGLVVFLSTIYVKHGGLFIGGV